MTAEAIAQKVEQLAAEFHAVYQQEAERQGDVRHASEYADLPENVKEFDRVLARHVVAKIDSLEAEVERVTKERDDYKADRDEYDAILGRRMAERDEARAENERLRAVVEAAYDPHSPDCAAGSAAPNDGDCDCGALAALETEEKA